MSIVLNFKYNLRPPEGWDWVCERELQLQDALWDRLVALEMGFREAVEDTIRGDDAYRRAADEILGTNAALEVLFGERRAQRQAARAKIKTPELDEKIAELAKRRREQWTKAKPLRSAAFKRFKDELKALGDQRYKDFTQARQESGLWWSNYNAVMQSFDATLRRIEPWQKPRILGNEGRGAGRLTVQIQHGCPGPTFVAGGRSEAGITLGGSKWRRVRGSNWRPRYGYLSATVHSEGRGTRKICRWPLKMHRPLPEGAIVKSVVITRKKPVPTAGTRWPPSPSSPPEWRWDVTLACEIPDPAQAAASVCSGVDLGWRKVEKGVRVATIADTAGGLDYVVFPLKELERRVKIAEEQGRVELIARRKDIPKTEHHDWERLSLEVARWNRRRRDLYRVAAIELVRRSHLIGLDSTGIATMAQDKRMPPETRRMRTWVAPAELAGFIRDAARKQGAIVRQIEGPSTLVCHHCGHRNEVPEDERLHLIWRCQGCRRIWDQDENAAKNCLAAVLEATSKEVVIKSDKPKRKPPRMTRKRKAEEQAQT